MAKYNKKSEWLKPYVRAAFKLAPKLRHVKTIYVKRPYHQTLNPAHAICWQPDEDIQEFHILIHSHYRVVKSKDPFQLKLLPFSKIDILISLAHEIAHLYHWHHTPEHKLLDSKILVLFMRILKRQGYTSEEDELNQKPYWL